MTKVNSSQVVSKLKGQFQSDHLFRNSIFLMLSSLVQAALGFGFWVLCARLYSAEEVGIGGALISTMTFISYVSLLGFNSTFVRFIPSFTSTSERDTQINTGLNLVLLAATLISAVYVILLPWLSSKLAFISAAPHTSIIFIILSALAATNLLTDSVFVALRQAHYNLLIYTVQSILKLALPFLFLSLGGFGIFTATALAAVLALVLSLGICMRYFEYRPALKIKSNVVKEVWKFSFINYIANIINMIPILAVPIMVLNLLGPKAAGYYYLAFTISNLLYAVAYATAQSLFAEGSYGEQTIKKLFVKSLKFMSSMMIPFSLILALIGPYILQIFGKDYTSEASNLLVILALSGPAVGLYILGTVVLRMTLQNKTLIGINILYSMLILSLSYLWSTSLTGFGYAWLAGNLAAGLLSVALFYSHRNFRSGKRIPLQSKE